MYFNNSKYTKWYYLIIENARNRILNGYCEKHHIIPKSFGGTQSKENLVCLTPREHFIVHLLLTKMCIEKIHTIKMKYALHRFMYTDKYKKRNYSARQYEIARKIYSNKGVSEETRQKLRLICKGKKLSPETKKKISEANKGRPSPFKKTPISIEEKQKKKDIFIERCRKMGLSNKGRLAGDKHPTKREEVRNKIKESSKGKIWINNGIVVTKIKKDQEIPDGFFLGMKLRQCYAS